MNHIINFKILTFEHVNRYNNGRQQQSMADMKTRRFSPEDSIEK